MRMPILALAGLLLSGPLAGQATSTRVELGAGGLYQSWEYGADLRPTLGLGPRLGVILRSGIGFEAQATFGSSPVRSTDEATDVSYREVLGFLTYTVPLGMSMDLLLRAGGGLAHYGSDCPAGPEAGGAPCGSGSAIGGGAGVRWHVGSQVALRAEGHLLTEGIEGASFLTYAGALGLSVFLGGAGAPDRDADRIPDRDDACPATPRGVAVDPSGCPEDADADGVVDRLDRCPQTPAGATVDGSGCPLDADHDGVPDAVDACEGTRAGASVDADGCAVDSDADGVPDGLDRCVATPANAAVDAIGCPSDLDGDGVTDTLDRCPGSQRGMPVDARGCSAGPLLWTVPVGAAGAGLAAPEVSVLLDEVAAVLRARPELTAEVRGFGPLVGRGEPGRRAVLERAEAVKTALVARGVAPDRLRTMGVAGEDDPRVDIALIGGGGR